MNDEPRVRMVHNAPPLRSDMDDEPKADSVVEVQDTKQVDFYGDSITAAQGIDGEVYVPINPLTAVLGLNRRGQQQRIERDPVLSKRMRTLRIDTGGGPQRFVCLPDITT